MARDRARSSFTVEVRRGRAPSGAEAPDPRKALWRGLDLAAESAALRDDPFAELRPQPALPSASLAPQAPRPQGRVLPSLLAPVPSVEPTEAAEPAPEAPRRRRTARPARPDPVRVEEPAAPVVDELFSGIEARIAETRVAETRSAETFAAEPRRRRRPLMRGGEPVLRAGERWKRRLPRACW